MTITVRKLKRLFAEIAREAEANPEFADRLATVLGTEARATGPNRRARRDPGVFDPYKVLSESGSEALRSRLRALSLEQIKDIVAEQGMDPARLVMKWRKPERIIEHVMSFVTSRERKGDVFRGEQ